LIAYREPHRKTEEVLQRLLGCDYELTIYTLPFISRPHREAFFAHRPNQSIAVAPGDIARKHGIPYYEYERDTDIRADSEIYLVLGANILSKECAGRLKIINCHPGVIPTSRGLDSFKWAIYMRKPLGVTLHYLDGNVDAGEIISVIPTDVYQSDSLESLSRRHYQNEIDSLVRFEAYLFDPINRFSNVSADRARMRMPLVKERELPELLTEYKKKYAV
jgi:phosphoribosylglycinamide formyltransferase 1